MDYAELRRIEREKKDQQEKEREAKAVAIAKQIAKDNPEWTAVKNPDMNWGRHGGLLIHKDGARAVINSHWRDHKIIGGYVPTQNPDHAGGERVEVGAGADQSVEAAAKSIARRLLPAVLTKYASHLENKAKADEEDNAYRALLTRFAKVCGTTIDKESIESYVRKKSANLDVIKDDKIRGVIDISPRAYNKITVNWLTPEQAEKVIAAIKGVL